MRAVAACRTPVVSAIGHEVDTFSKEFANNFDAWTSPEIAKEIDTRFGKDAAFQIKRKWGLRHLTLMLKADGLESAKNAIAVLSRREETMIAASNFVIVVALLALDFDLPISEGGIGEDFRLRRFFEG